MSLARLTISLAVIVEVSCSGTPDDPESFVGAWSFLSGTAVSSCGSEDVELVGNIEFTAAAGTDLIANSRDLALFCETPMVVIGITAHVEDGETCQFSASSSQSGEIESVTRSFTDNLLWLSNDKTRINLKVMTSDHHVDVMSGAQRDCQGVYDGILTRQVL